MYLANYAAFSTVPFPAVPADVYIVAGYSAAGDGGEGTFIWVPNPNFPTPFNVDGGVAIAHPAESTPGMLGYFKRIFSGPINVRWFGAKGDGFTDDTLAVYRARMSLAYANNGTLYFPVGTYPGAFIFDDPSGYYNEINIKGDGHGSVLCSNGSLDSHGNANPVVAAGWRYFNEQYARISDLTIDGTFSRYVDGTLVSTPRFSDGIRLANPSYTGPNLTDAEAGYWVFERVLFKNCQIGVLKAFGNIGNHFIDCTWISNHIGVDARQDVNYVNGELILGMQCGCDRYTGCYFAVHTDSGLVYTGECPQLIIDGAIMEQNPGWAIQISRSGEARMAKDAVCLRNIYFERNGSGLSGGDMYFEGVRSVRIDDSRVAWGGRMRLEESSVNLYNCHMGSNAASTDIKLDVDEKSSLVAYEHRYESFPTSRIFVNSISYDGSHDIAGGSGQLTQSTSVWGPLRNVTSTGSALVSEQFDTVTQPFSYVTGGLGPQNTVIMPDRVLGKGSGRLGIASGGTIRSDNVLATIGPDPIPKYIVWSIHAFLQSQPPSPVDDLEQIYGEIKTNSVNLGHVYFKYHQWACSYGMKLVDVSSQLDFRLYFTSTFSATFYITDFQIVAFDNLASANAFVNSREFRTWHGWQ